MPFFVNEWMAEVGPGWTLGTAAFLTIFAFLGVVLLMWRGAKIRRFSIASVASSEEGLKLTGSMASKLPT